MSTVQFTLPDLGEGLDEAEIVAWLVAPGDRVARDQEIVEVQTDKATIVLPCPVAGTVSRLAAAQGAKVAVGAVLIDIETAAPADASSPGTAPTAPSLTAEPAPTPSPAADQRGRRVKAAPSVRKLAVELGVDINKLAPSDPDGRVTDDDVRLAAAGGARRGEIASGMAPAPPPEPPARVGDPAPRLGWHEPGRHPIRGVRRAVAQTMATSWSTIPHITGMDEIDASALLAARNRLRQAVPGRSEHLTIVPLVVKAVARALRRFPMLNASIEGDAFVVHEQVHLGVAVATSEGLVVPVIHHADRKGLLQIGAELTELAGRVRAQRATPAELRGGTFTISNYGSLGGRFATPLIRPPEVGILGTGAIRERPIAVAGQVRAAPTMPLSLSVDHRLIDGDLATAFLEHVAGSLADPVLLLAEE